MKVIRDLARRTALHAKNIIFLSQTATAVYFINLRWVLLRKRRIIWIYSLKAA